MKEAKKPSRSSENQQKNEPKSMEKRHWKDAGAETRQMGGRPAAAGSTADFMGSILEPFSVRKSRKIEKNTIRKNMIKRPPKNMKTYDEKVPKRNRNECQNASEIGAEKGSGEYHEKHKKSWFSDV